MRFKLCVLEGKQIENLCSGYAAGHFIVGSQQSE